MSPDARRCDCRAVKRALLAVAALLLPVLVVMSGAAPPVSAAPGGYTTYVACSLKPSAKPARKCNLSGPKAAFFRSAKRDVVYKVCAKLVGKGNHPLCASGIEAPKGKTTLLSLALSTAGKYTVTWSVAGHVVGSRTVKIIDDLQ